MADLPLHRILDARRRRARYPVGDKARFADAQRQQRKFAPGRFETPRQPLFRGSPPVFSCGYDSKRSRTQVLSERLTFFPGEDQLDANRAGDFSRQGLEIVQVHPWIEIGPIHGKRIGNLTNSKQDDLGSQIGGHLSRRNKRRSGETGVRVKHIYPQRPAGVSRIACTTAHVPQVRDLLAFLRKCCDVCHADGDLPSRRP